MDALSARRRSIVRRTRAANLFGAVMAFAYFRFIDPMTAGPEVAWPEIVFSVVAFTGLTLVGVRIGSRWAAPIGSGDPAAPEVRRRALMFPWAMAAVVFGGWVMAGVVWGVVWPLLAGTFTLPSAVRAGIGITAVGGVVTATIVFFSIENRWRHELVES